MWVLGLVAVTGLGVWLASSLVAFAGGPAALACVGGVLLFPVLPLWWEKRASDAFYARLRVTRRLLPKKRALTGATRIALRTVFINLVFVAVLLFAWPKVAFAALATRGDWFLGDEKGPWVDRTRAVVVAASSGLEWLHEAAHENPYRTKEDEKTPVPEDVKPVVSVVTEFGSGARWRRPDPEPETPAPVDEPPDAVFDVGHTRWPWKREVHPVIAGMTVSDETSPEAVGRYISARVTDPFQRVKALHDWVVTRLRYDHASLTGTRKPQDARSVFDSRTGVCEGYARLLVELGKHTDTRIVYVTGDVRNDDGSLAPIGHAWNAVEVQGAWYVMDATWDDATMSDGSESYSTDYLFIPPEVAGLDHFPDEARWQLRSTPLSRAAFLRQALARPGFAKERLTLQAPERMVVDVDDTFSLRMENPANTYLMLHIGDQVCGPVNDVNISLDCPVPNGANKAVLFSNHERDGNYDDVAIFTLR